MFCTDAASARPEACRDKSKGPRSGDFAGRSPGVQGGGGDWPPPVRSLRHKRQNADPLCAPCAMSDITQKAYRERNVC
ncbi:DNA helicase [Klebsiella pneumoniae]|nr:DNA helicase [Klebsiella pneumoniae]